MADDELDEYRKHLLVAEQKAQEDFDKTVIALSGGALGVSFAFLGNVVRDKPLVDPPLIIYAWLSWAISLAFVLVSYFVSIRALRVALKQAYDGSIYSRRPGGALSIAIDACNIVGGLLFFAGLLLIALFMKRNLG